MPSAIHSIKGAVQHYAWGKDGRSRPLVRQVWEVQNGEEDANGDEEKYAEIWLGTHPNGPSKTNSSTTLLELIESDPVFFLGSQHSAKNLPYLLKLLSIQKVLSIQSHPDLELAAKLHEQNPAVYKDACHKPEMAIALTPFVAMCGFRPLGIIVENLSLYPEIARIVSAESVDGIKAAYGKTMGLVDFDTTTQLALKALFSSFMANFDTSGTKPLSDCIERLKAKNKDDMTELDVLILDFSRQFPGDCGVFSPLFLAVHKLSPGSSLFVPANTPHAYITGEIIECMARSDNVIRCGLTPKFKDVGVLCDSLSYDTTPQSPCDGGDIGGNTKLYRPPVNDFEVRVITGGGTYNVDAGLDSGSLLLALGGACTLVINDGAEKLHLKRGEAAFLAANHKLTVENATEDLKIVRSTRNLRK